MEKLVITWTWGDMCCSGETVDCVEYESAEAFYVHLEEKVVEYIRQRAEYNVAVEKWMNSKKIEDRPKYIEEEFVIGNLKWRYDNFVTTQSYESKDKFIPRFNPPEIQTLEEWFEIKKKNENF